MYEKTKLYILNRKQNIHKKYYILEKYLRILN
ncbi:hypothetical protein BCF50_2626 [Chryseobacterium daecheongense]|uniref:Uncharacterized protein n=1 Tax=Chryseobacterium daecheongense TaxID=192389 RepID=A0ABY2FSQ9_9FLAO|nr:hypothetical protein BCF50_2626 [Chryseobacterium daecheongense]